MSNGNDGAGSAPSGPGYLIEVISDLDGAGVDPALLRRLTGAMVDWLVRDPQVGEPPTMTPEEDLAAQVVLGAIRRALEAGDVAGALQAVALGVPLAMRFGASPSTSA